MYEELDKSIKALSGEEVSKLVLEELDSIDEEKKKIIGIQIKSLIDKQTSDVKVALSDLKATVDSKIQALASSTKDLEKVPFFGKVGLFIRGMQRPVWALVLIYVDLKVLSGVWDITTDAQLKSAFWLLNLLILGFLFGERAVKNVIPVINQHIGNKKV